MQLFLQSDYSELSIAKKDWKEYSQEIKITKHFITKLSGCNMVCMTKRIILVTPKQFPYASLLWISPFYLLTDIFCSM